MSKKATIEFEGFNEVISRLNNIGANTKKITENALKATHELVIDKAEKAIRPHKKTGETENSLYRQFDVEWVGNIASVPIGFSIRKGGLASIFLMYGTPRMKKDQNLYNSIFGKATRKEVTKIQSDIYYEELRRLNG